MYTYDDLSDELVRRFPELTAAYERYLAEWDEEKPGQHTTYEYVLNPYLDTLLIKGKAEALTKVFGYLEELANHPDVEVGRVVTVTVCEHWVDSLDLLRKARTFMGPMTRKNASENEMRLFSVPQD